MKIRKFGHACIFVEEGAANILFDPGSWNTTPALEALDAIIITHNHQDHFALDQIKELLTQFPQAVVITNKEVGATLTEAGIPFKKVEDGEVTEVQGVSITGIGAKHEIIYGDMPKCHNVGYVVGKRLFVPGDSFHDFPAEQVEILALPTGGPWMRLSEAVEYAKRISPKVVFPIHDAMYVESVQREMVPRIVGGNLEAAGITFRDMASGATLEF